MSRKNRANRIVNADDALVRLWGKPLSERDVEICRALGWAEMDETASCPIWRSAPSEYPFDGAIHSDGVLSKFDYDNELVEFLHEHSLACLNRRFGSNHKSKLRTLLTLIHMVRTGLAECVRGERFLMFVGTLMLSVCASPGDDPEGEGDAEGHTITVIDDDGNQIDTPTPLGFFNELGNETVDEFMLHPILDELGRRGLMERSLSTGSVGKWRVTSKGIESGLDRTDISAADLLVELGLESFLSSARDKWSRSQKIKELH